MDVVREREGMIALEKSDGEHGEVIALLGVAHIFFDGCMHGVNLLFCRHLPKLLGYIYCLLFLEKYFLRIFGFGQTIGVEEQRVTTA